jgi:predicted RNA-binding protein YlxR (DUF448 family)
MSKKGHVPIRLCIGCRKKRNKGEMIRFTQSSEGKVGLDESKHLHGRGFYLCPDLWCFNMAKKKTRGIGFLKNIDFQSPLMDGFFRKKRVEIEEERNDKE